LMTLVDQQIMNYHNPTKLIGKFNLSDGGPIFGLRQKHKQAGEYGVSYVQQKNRVPLLMTPVQDHDTSSWGFPNVPHHTNSTSTNRPALGYVSKQERDRDRIIMEPELLVLPRSWSDRSVRASPSKKAIQEMSLARELYDQQGVFISS
jgi:hypothetical protein